MQRTRTIAALVLVFSIAACSNAAAPDSREVVRPGAPVADAAPAPTPADSTTAARGGNLMGGN